MARSAACPRPVFEEYQRIQRRLEAQPVRFLQRELQPLMAEARASLAGFLDVGAADLVFVTNPTYAVNAIARSLGLGRDDEIVTSNHEYGACRNVWQFAEQRSGCSVVEVPLDVTIGTDEQFVEQVFAGVTERTRLIFLSHITSATALTLPVAAVCSRARELGILTLIDGAHAPGQIDLAVRSVGAAGVGMAAFGERAPGLQNRLHVGVRADAEHGIRVGGDPSGAGAEHALNRSQ